MNVTKYLLLVLMGIMTLTGAQFAAAEEKWLVRGHLGYSQVSDQSAAVSDFDLGVSALDAEVDSGFTSGLGIGYQITPSWMVELGWEYRTNDAEVTLNNGRAFNDGNYASNMFYLNGIYSFSVSGLWQPYVGAGLIVTQEIDIDLEEDGAERSFSGSGDTGLQVFAGVNRELTENWVLQGELRYGSISSIDLDEEGGTGKLTGFDYKPFTLQVGLGYRF